MILIVEDDAMQRLGLEMVLEDAGFSVLSAASADEALTLLANASVAAVISDIRMPGSMDGIALATAVRERWPPVKVILVSGHARPGEGPVGVPLLMKPLGHKQLLLELDRLLH